jgi:hypothetical protein
MTETASIFKGDTAGPWNVGHMLDSGSLATLGVSYACTIKVAGAGIERAVTDKNGDNTRFIAALTPTETETLAPGQYVVAIEVANPTTVPPLRVETHIILTVTEQIVGSDHIPEPATTLERLQAHREQLLDAKDEAIGGIVVEVWNGRYGNKMKYNGMTYDQICAALDRVNREIAGEEAKAAGYGRRRAISIRYGN